MREKSVVIYLKRCFFHYYKRFYHSNIVFLHKCTYWASYTKPNFRCIWAEEKGLTELNSKLNHDYNLTWVFGLISKKYQPLQHTKRNFISILQ